MFLLIRLETRLARPRLGNRARMLAGAIWMQPPIQFSPIWVFISCEATMVTMRLAGWVGDRQRIGSRAYGVRSVWYLPGSAAPVSRGIRWYSSAHSSTHSSGSGLSPRRYAARYTAAPSAYW
ncbi:hypothetical protein D9M69_653540 [compost metagenome]